MGGQYPLPSLRGGMLTGAFSFVGIIGLPLGVMLSVDLSVMLLGEK